MNKTKQGVILSRHPEPRLLPLGCAPKSFYSGSRKLQDSGSGCLVNRNGEIPNQVWNDSFTRGFTLIELLVVVLIIGVLAAIAVPQYQKAVMKSRYAVMKHLLRTLAEAQEVYYLSNNDYADTLDKLDFSLGNSAERCRQYNWGQCCISTAKYLGYCTNNQINMEYQTYFTHAPFSVGGRLECVVKKSKDETQFPALQVQICKAETGKSRPSSSNDTNQIWPY